MAKNNFAQSFVVPKKPTKTTAMDRFSTADRLIHGSQDAANSSDLNAPDTTPPHSAPVTVDLLLRDVPEGEFRNWCVTNSYVPGAVITLPLKAVKRSPFNPRHFYKKESIAELALNLSAQTQQHPIHVTPD